MATKLEVMREFLWSRVKFFREVLLFEGKCIFSSEDVVGISLYRNLSLLAK